MRDAGAPADLSHPSHGAAAPPPPPLLPVASAVSPASSCRPNSSASPRRARPPLTSSSPLLLFSPPSPCLLPRTAAATVHAAVVCPSCIVVCPGSLLSAASAAPTPPPRNQVVARQPSSTRSPVGEIQEQNQPALCRPGFCVSAARTSSHGSRNSPRFIACPSASLSIPSRPALGFARVCGIDHRHKENSAPVKTGVMFKRTLSQKASSLTMGKRHSRLPSAAVAATSAAAAPPPSRTLTMSATSSANASACHSLVSEAPPHRRLTTYKAMSSLETTAEEPVDLGSEPLFDDSFLSSEPSDDYFESSKPTADSHFQRLPTLSIDTDALAQKYRDVSEADFDDDEFPSVDDFARYPSLYGGNDVATAVYIARPSVRPRMVDISPTSASRRSSMAPSEASARDFNSHSRSSSYFNAHNSYSRTSSFSNSSDSGSLQTASPLTPPSMYGTGSGDDAEAKTEAQHGEAAVVTVAKVTHIRNLSASAPKSMREKVVAARLAGNSPPGSLPSSRVGSIRKERLRASTDAKRPPLPLPRSTSTMQAIY